MPLPKYNTEYSNFVEINGNKIHFRPWTTKDEKNYLILTESYEVVTENQIFEILIKPCLENPDIPLTLDERKLLMLKIREKSIGPTFQAKYQCTSCKKVNEPVIKIDGIIHYKEDEFKNIKVKDLEFIFGKPKTNNLINKLEGVENVVEYNFIEFLIHINGIIIDGNLEENFTYNELQDFVESLPTDIFDEVYNEFTKIKGRLELYTDVQCDFCEENNTIQFGNMPNFLWA